MSIGNRLYSVHCALTYGSLSVVACFIQMSPSSLQYYGVCSASHPARSALTVDFRGHQVCHRIPRLIDDDKALLSAHHYGGTKVDFNIHAIEKLT